MVNGTDKAFALSSDETPRVPKLAALSHERTGDLAILILKKIRIPGGKCGNMPWHSRGQPEVLGSSPSRDSI